MVPHIGMVVPGQNVQSPVITISDLWGQTVRLGIALDKLTHLRETLVKRRRQFHALAPAEHGRRQKHFRHQAVIGQARLIVHAIREYLPIHLAHQCPNGNAVQPSASRTSFKQRPR